MNTRQGWLLFLLLLTFVVAFPLFSLSKRSTTTLETPSLLNLTSPQQQLTPLIRLAFVTAASSNHFCWATELIASIQKYEPSATIFFYDIGLVESERRSLESVDGLQYRRFPFEKFPEYFNVSVAAGEYAWKPVIIAEVLEKAEYVIWMDAGDRVVSTFQPLLTYLNKHGFFSVTSRGNLRGWTHPGTLRYLKVDEALLDLPSCNAAFLGFSRNHTKDMVKKWAECAQIKNCIAPPGSSLKNHRQDQAVLSVLVWQSPQKFSCGGKEDLPMMYFTHNDQRRPPPGAASATKCKKTST